jgi:predicted RND superfamily exporter protein
METEDNTKQTNPDGKTLGEKKVKKVEVKKMATQKKSTSGNIAWSTDKGGNIQLRMGILILFVFIVLVIIILLAMSIVNVPAGHNK